jgi:uncharacterized damage-inducible protein DinB
MQAIEAIRTALQSTQQMLNWYLSDLSDADLLLRPTPGANHIAWQLGHLVVGERELVKPQLPNEPYPELPAGFAEQHNKDTAAQDPPTGFATKGVYLDLFNRSRQVTLAALAKLKDADLDRPTAGNMAKFAPNLGALLLLVSNHVLMHAGQVTVVRRKLGKPVLF